MDFGEYYTFVASRFQGMLNETWNWFNSLHYQEWFLLLGIVASVGFLCMRGFSSRGRI